MKIKSIKDVKNLSGKRVLLRADFNVPIRDGVIKDDYRIQSGLRTIKYLKKQHCKIIVISHLGRPEGKRDEKYTLRPVAERMGKILKRKVEFIPDTIGFEAGSAIQKMKNGEILLLENIRFYEEETKNDKKFAKQLAKLADIYVNDAFAVSHRAEASVSAIKKFIPSYAGLLLGDEVANLYKVLAPEQPLIAVLGGVKIETKLPLIKNLSKKAKKILVGGALANNFLAAHGYEIGKSKADKKDIELAKKLMSEKMVYPVDVIVSRITSGKETRIPCSVTEVRKNDTIYDIGPKTVRLYSTFIREGRTIVWNGPMGFFEDDHYRHGTLALAKVIAARSKGFAYGAVGGGETVEALQMTKMDNWLDWVSTGGGAMLSYLGGEKMPGLDGLIK